MKSKSNIAKRTAWTKTKPDGLARLIAEVRHLIQSARRATASVVNTLQVLTNFEIGRRIVEHEQKGATRAGYGQELLKTLSARLTGGFGQGFSRSNLQNMRTFFLLWDVNYYDRHVKLPEENATIGLLLCKEKKDAVVKLTLPKDANIHAREYQLYLPSKELLKAKLLEWTQRERMKARGGG